MNKIIIVVAIFTLNSCGPSYYKRKIPFHKSFEEKNYTGAQTFLEKNSADANSETKFIYYLDKGTVEHYLGNYEESSKSFEEACKINDAFILKEPNSVLVCPSRYQYNGEGHEILLIHYFKALNYLFLNNLEEALVECKRFDQKLKLMKDKYGAELAYNEDAFAHLLMGIIYQANEEYYNAFIAYRNSLNAYEKIYKTYFRILIHNN